VVGQLRARGHAQKVHHGHDDSRHRAPTSSKPALLPAHRYGELRLRLRRHRAGAGSDTGNVDSRRLRRAQTARGRAREEDLDVAGLVLGSDDPCSRAQPVDELEGRHSGLSTFIVDMKRALTRDRCDPPDQDAHEPRDGRRSSRSRRLSRTDDLVGGEGQGFRDILTE